MPLPSGLRAAGEQPGIEEAMMMGLPLMPGPPSGPDMPMFPGGAGPASPSPEQVERRRLEEKKRQQEALVERRMQERGAEVSQPMQWSMFKKPDLDVDADKAGLRRATLAVPIKIDGSQQLRVGGTYMPSYSENGVTIPSTYGIEAGYETPGLNVRVRYSDRRRGGGGMGGPEGGGFEAGVKGNLNW